MCVRGNGRVGANNALRRAGEARLHRRGVPYRRERSMSTSASHLAAVAGTGRFRFQSSNPWLERLRRLPVTGDGVVQNAGSPVAALM